MSIAKIITNILSRTTASTLAVNGVTRAEVIEARTATATGATTGTIGATTTHVVPTCTNATHIFILPSMTVGQVITFDCAAANNYVIKVPTGYTVNGSASTTSATMTKTTKTVAKCVAPNTIQVIAELADGTGVKTLPTFA